MMEKQEQHDSSAITQDEPVGILFRLNARKVKEEMIKEVETLGNGFKEDRRKCTKAMSGFDHVTGASLSETIHSRVNGRPGHLQSKRWMSPTAIAAGMGGERLRGRHG